jgi:hypothetical protein
MGNRLVSATAALLLLPCAAVLATGTRALVTLSLDEQTVKHGDPPRFVVQIQAVSRPLRVLKFAARDDLKHAYVRVIVTRSGSPVDVPRVISDPGPTSDSDYIDLRPGQEMSFAHDGMPLVLSSLPAGDYLAQVKVWPDWRSEPVLSNSVAFRVVQR